MYAAQFGCCIVSGQGGACWCGYRHRCLGSRLDLCLPWGRQAERCRRNRLFGQWEERHIVPHESEFIASHLPVPLLCDKQFTPRWAACRSNAHHVFALPRLKAGVMFQKKVGDHVAVGDTICTLYSSKSEQALDSARQRISSAVVMGAAGSIDSPKPLISHYLDDSGLQPWDEYLKQHS